MIKPLRWFALVLFTLLPALASAQQQGLEIDIIGGNASALPITVVPMPYQGTAAAPATDVAAVVRADLERSGAFRTLPVPPLTPAELRALCALPRGGGGGDPDPATIARVIEKSEGNPLFAEEILRAHDIAGDPAPAAETATPITTPANSVNTGRDGDSAIPRIPIV